MITAYVLGGLGIFVTLTEWQPLRDFLHDWVSLELVSIGSLLLLLVGGMAAVLQLIKKWID
jgi:type IV secretory pathway VirB6-like protein